MQLVPRRLADHGLLRQMPGCQEPATKGGGFGALQQGVRELLEEAARMLIKRCIDRAG